MKNIILLSILSLTLFSACQKESLQPNENANIPKLDEENYLQLSTIMKRYESAFLPVEYILEKQSTRSSCFWTSIAAGSTNALNDAIANTCPSGTIFFEAGTHIQNEPVLISKSIKLVGADGATINVDAELTLSNESGALPLNPIFHIANTTSVLIQNLEINSLTDGGTAFLIEESDRCGFINNTINGFQMAMVNEKSNELVAINNTIVNGGLWQTGAVSAAHSIINMNGKSCYFSNNEISNSLFGVWACDQYGTYENNTTTGNFIGLILCNVPAGVILPTGELTGSANPADNWKIRNNSSSNNLNAGYLVIDGAKGNVLTNNSASNNGTFDIELAGDTERFGFLSPTSTRNYVNIGNQSDLTLKDCGDNNIVEGAFNIIDNISEPCL